MNYQNYPQEPRQVNFQGQGQANQNVNFNSYYNQMRTNAVQQNNIQALNQQEQNQKNIQLNILRNVFQTGQVPTQVLKQLQYEEFTVDILVNNRPTKIKMFKQLTNIFLQRLLDSKFPKSKPLLYFTQYLIHRSIKDNTWQINYEEFYKWTPESNLKDLFVALSNFYSSQGNQPQIDPYREQIEYKLNKVNEQIEIQKMKQKNLNQIFTDVKPDQYKKIFEDGQVNKYIWQLPEYKLMVDYLVELSQTNEALANDLINRQKDLQKQREDIKQLADLYENQKNELILKFSQCTSIKERFTKTKALSLIENQINNLDDQSNDMFEGINSQSDQQQIILVSQEKKSFENEIQAYFDLRKKYHRLVIKKEKFNEMI